VTVTEGEAGSANGTGEVHDDVAARTGGKQLLAGGSILAIAMVLANAGNYLLNVLLGRWLTPAEFADANLMVTLMLLVTAIAVSLQLIGARYAGVDHAAGSPQRTDLLAGWLERRAGMVGLVLGAVLIIPATMWQEFFKTDSAWPFVILGAGMPFYLAQAVGRGVLQGRLGFVPLAATFVAEMICRVSVGVALVALGYGVEGATVGLTASFVVTWIAVRALYRRTEQGRPVPERLTDLRSYSWPVAVLLLGQIIINNGDVLISKRFLDPETAGVYAAIALIGRAVFFLSWSVATTLFPAAAQRDEAGQDSGGLLKGGLVAVAAIGIACTIGARLLGGIVLGRVFGPEYAGVSEPLALYALATSLFAMANLIVTTHLSTGRVREGYVLLAGGALQTTLLMFGRNSIDSLITAQVIAMAVLFVAVGISHLYATRSASAPVAAETTKAAVLAQAATPPAALVTPAVEATPATANPTADHTARQPHEEPAMESSQYAAYRKWASQPLAVAPKISVVIPAYNEAERIVPTIGAIALHMSGRGEPWELLIADDGSTDDTVEMIGDLDLPNLNLLVAQQNGGKGSAVRRGVLAARGDVVLFADADQSTPIEQFDAVYAHLLDGADVAIGSRAADGSQEASKSVLRRVMSGGLRMLVKMLFNVGVKDTQCGFKMFTAKAANDLFRRQRIDGFSFDLEVLYLAEKFGYRIDEVPVEWIDAPGSTVDAAKVAVRFLVDLIVIRVDDLRGRYRTPRAAVSQTA